MADQDEEIPTGVRSLSPERVDEIKGFVRKVSENLHDLELEVQQDTELKMHLTSLEEHLATENPEHSLVDEALEAMHRVLESSTARKTAELLAEAGRFLTGVG